MVTVLLAAGSSTRMGQPKLLLPFEGKPLFLAALESALIASEQVIMVTGWYHEQIEQAAEPYLFAYPGRLVLIRNEHPRRGQFSSTSAGVRAVPEGKNFSIAMADAPLVGAHHYQTLESLLGSHEAVRPFCSGTPGHPVLCSASLRQAILSQPEGATMRKLLEDRDVVRHDSADPAWITDIDTPDAYKSLIARSKPFAPD